MQQLATKSDVLDKKHHWLNTIAVANSPAPSTTWPANQSFPPLNWQSATARRKTAGSTWDLSSVVKPQRRNRKPTSTPVEVRPQDLAVLAITYQVRFVTASIVQRWLQLGGRTAREYLTRLSDLGELRVFPARNMPPNWPNTYVISTRGINRLNDHLQSVGQDQVPRVREWVKQSGRSQASLLHDVGVSEITLGMYQTLKAAGDLLAKVEVRFFRRERRLTYLAAGARRSVQPDAGFVIKRAGESRARLFLLEYDLASESITAFRKKLERYHEWSKSDEGKEQLAELVDHGDFRLLIVCHDPYLADRDEERLANLYLLGLEFPQRFRNRLLFTTVERLREHVHDPQPLNCPEWHYLSDGRSVLRELRNTLGPIPKGAGKTLARHRRFVARTLKATPRRQLFRE